MRWVSLGALVAAGVVLAVFWGDVPDRWISHWGVHGADGWSARGYWLIWASNDATGEEKFFLSNAPADSPVEVLMRVAFRRAAVEHSFRVCKTELGFTHFEGRNYVALMRHLTLCLAALGFVAEHTEQLRGEKPGDDDGAGVPWAGGGMPELAAAAGGVLAPRKQFFALSRQAPLPAMRA